MIRRESPPQIAKLVERLLLSTFKVTKKVMYATIK